MEPFRPVVDRIVMQNVSDSFDREVRLVLADMVNRCLTYRGGSYKMGSVVSLFIQDCLNALNKKILPDDIEGFEV